MESGLLFNVKQSKAAIPANWSWVVRIELIVYIIAQCNAVDHGVEDWRRERSLIRGLGFRRLRRLLRHHRSLSISTGSHWEEIGRSL